MYLPYEEDRSPKSRKSSTNPLRRSHPNRHKPFKLGDEKEASLPRIRIVKKKMRKKSLNNAATNDKNEVNLNLLKLRPSF